MAYTTINKSTDHFNTKLYTGNGGTQSITGVGFQPDWVWIKQRSNAEDHFLFDSVRGVKKRIISNTADAEDTHESLTSFNSDGFSLGNARNEVNQSGASIVSWNWKANGAGSANTDGSISSTVSVNATAGFSIVTVANVGSGDFTFGHGLGVAPSWVLAKSRDGGSWNNYFKSLGAGYTTQFTTGAKISNTSIWQNTAPTSSVVYSNGNQLDSNESYVFYCFAEKTGYSKFGSYSGNGNADGSFIYCGFKPALILIKQTNSTGSWYMWDNKRDTINPYQRYISPNNANAEYTSSERWLDSLSNGFKWRNTETAMNGSGSSYIFMAFAEAPLVGTNNVPCTAR